MVYCGIHMQQYMSCAHKICITSQDTREKLIGLIGQVPKEEDAFGPAGQTLDDMARTAGEVCPSVLYYGDSEVEQDSCVQGKVSIMAHSLGSVLTYDILCNQPDLYSALNVRPLSASPSNRRSSAR